MIIGDPSTLAIEYEIDHVTDLTQRQALGFFCVHVDGHRYGVKAPDATMLGNSVTEVATRLRDRGQHTAPFANEDALSIAKAYRKSVYEDCPSDELIFGLPIEQLSTMFQQRLQWAPDGDEAFDDSSYILQFDVASDVRIIAFQTNDAGEPVRETLTDATVPAEAYYELLRAWLAAFDSQLSAMSRVH